MNATPSPTVVRVATCTGDIALAQLVAAGLAPLASPPLTGTPTAPTAALATNTTQLATCAFVLANAPSAPVSSVFTRTGAVTAQSGDYTVAQITGAAALAGAAFTGAVSVTAPTDATVPFTVAGHSATQSADLQDWTVNGSVVAFISKTGQLNTNTGIYVNQNPGIFGCGGSISFQPRATAVLMLDDDNFPAITAKLIAQTNSNNSTVPGFEFFCLTTCTPAYQFNVPTSTSTGFSIVGATSQANDLFQAQNVSKVVLFANDKLGRPYTANTTPTIAAGTGAGTSPTVSVTGTDVNGYVTITTGTSCASSAVVATITFSAAYASAPKSVIITPAEVNAAALTLKPYASQAGIGTSSWTLNIGGTALTDATTYKFYYQVLG